MTTDPFNLVGTAIDDKYRIDEMIGEGGFGVVYKGFHDKLDIPIAVKCLKVPGHFTVEAKELFLDKFQDEGRHLAKLSEHRSITRVYDFGVTSGVPFLVLEWLQGQDLEQLLAVRRFTEAEAVEFLRPAIDALAFAHSSGIAHRDIKPANLLSSQAQGFRRGGRSGSTHRGSSACSCRGRALARMGSARPRLGAWRGRTAPRGSGPCSGAVAG